MATPTDAELIQRSRRSAEAFREPRRRTVVRGPAVAVLVAAIAAGAAVAGGLFSEEQVASGMPAGSAIFGGTHPSCVLHGDEAVKRHILVHDLLGEYAPAPGRG
jgi:hypothetical protein